MCGCSSKLPIVMFNRQQKKRSIDRCKFDRKKKNIESAITAADVLMNSTFDNISFCLTNLYHLKYHVSINLKKLTSSCSGNH
jgi:hypothetical protein